MSTKSRDQLVQELLEVVKKKKEEISKAERTSYITNASFQLGTDRININTVSQPEDLVKILASILKEEEFYEKAVSQLGVKSTFEWQGFSVADWRDDLRTRLNKINVTNKKKELVILEDKLNKLESQDAREQRELESIQKTLGL